MSRSRHEVTVLYVPAVPGSNATQIADMLDEGYDMLACVVVPAAQGALLAYTMARETQTAAPDVARRGRPSKLDD